MTCIDNYYSSKDNFAVDRELGERLRQVYPAIADLARSDRQFLNRAVRCLAGEAGIRQFLDIGSGLPTVDNTHEVAQSVAPASRIVYVDNDPLVLLHARVLLTSGADGATDYIEADFRDPDAGPGGGSQDSRLHPAGGGYREGGAETYHLRGPGQLARFFAGLDLVPPGLVPVPQWRPDPGADAGPAQAYSYCAIGRVK